MKNKLNSLLLATAFIMGSGMSVTSDPRPTGETPGAPPPKGLKQFIFHGFKCWAINQKSANKKYQKFLATQRLKQ